MRRGGDIMEEVKNSKKRIALRIFSVILILWILLVGIDFVRFVSADIPTKPLLTISSGGCRCGESESENGLGYSYGYYYDISSSYSQKNPESAYFTIFGIELYSKEF